MKLSNHLREYIEQETSRIISEEEKRTQIKPYRYARSGVGKKYVEREIKNLIRKYSDASFSAAAGGRKKGKYNFKRFRTLLTDPSGTSVGDIEEPYGIKSLITLKKVTSDDSSPYTEKHKRALHNGWSAVVNSIAKTVNYPGLVRYLIAHMDKGQTDEMNTGKSYTNEEILNAWARQYYSAMFNDGVKQTIGSLSNRDKDYNKFLREALNEDAVKQLISAMAIRLAAATEGFLKMAKAHVLNKKEDEQKGEKTEPAVTQAKPSVPTMDLPSTDPKSIPDLDTPLPDPEAMIGVGGVANVPSIATGQSPMVPDDDVGPMPTDKSDKPYGSGRKAAVDAVQLDTFRRTMKAINNDRQGADKTEIAPAMLRKLLRGYYNKQGIQEQGSRGPAFETEDVNAVLKARSATIQALRGNVNAQYAILSLDDERLGTQLTGVGELIARLRAREDLGFTDEDVKIHKAFRAWEKEHPGTIYDENGRIITTFQGPENEEEPEPVGPSDEEMHNQDAPPVSADDDPEDPADADEELEAEMPDEDPFDPAAAVADAPSDEELTQGVEDKEMPGLDKRMKKRAAAARKRRKPLSKMRMAGGITRKMGTRSVSDIQRALKAYFPEKSRTFGTLREQKNNDPDGKWGDETYKAVIQFQKDLKILISQAKLTIEGGKLPSGKSLDDFQIDGIWGPDTEALAKAATEQEMWNSGARVSTGEAEDIPSDEAGATGSDVALDARGREAAEILKKRAEDEFKDVENPAAKQAGIDAYSETLLGYWKNSDLNKLGKGMKDLEAEIENVKKMLQPAIDQFKKDEKEREFREKLKAINAASDALGESKFSPYLTNIVIEEVDKILTEKENRSMPKPMTDKEAEDYKKWKDNMPKSQFNLGAVSGYGPDDEERYQAYLRDIERKSAEAEYITTDLGKTADAYELEQDKKQLQKDRSYASDPSGNIKDPFDYNQKQIDNQKAQAANQKAQADNQKAQAHLASVKRKYLAANKRVKALDAVLAIIDSFGNKPKIRKIADQIVQQTRQFLDTTAKTAQEALKKKGRRQMLLLRRGKAGESKRIADIQEKLIKHGMLPSSIDGKRQLDNSWGWNTLTAIMRFQKEAGLYIDGLVGPKTSELLDSLDPFGQAEAGGIDPKPIRSPAGERGIDRLPLSGTTVPESKSYDYLIKIISEEIDKLLG